LLNLFLLCKSPHATLVTVDDRTCPKEEIIFQGGALHLDQLLGDGGDIALEIGAVDLFDLLSLLLAVVDGRRSRSRIWERKVGSNWAKSFLESEASVRPISLAQVLSNS